MSKSPYIIAKSTEVVVYEIKLEKSVKVILGMFSLGIILNAVTPDFPVKEALAQSLSHGGSISVHCYGCN
jgi:hypothetical protein